MTSLFLLQLLPGLCSLTSPSSNPQQEDQEQQQQLLLNQYQQQQQKQQQQQQQQETIPNQITQLAQEFQKNLATLNPIPLEKLRDSLHKEQEAQKTHPTPPPPQVEEDPLQSTLLQTLAQVKERVALQQQRQQQELELAQEQQQRQEKLAQQQMEMEEVVSIHTYQCNIMNDKFIFGRFSLCLNEAGPNGRKIVRIIICQN